VILFSRRRIVRLLVCCGLCQMRHQSIVYVAKLWLPQYPAVAWSCCGQAFSGIAPVPVKGSAVSHPVMQPHCRPTCRTTQGFSGPCRPARCQHLHIHSPWTHGIDQWLPLMLFQANLGQSCTLHCSAAGRKVHQDNVTPLATPTRPGRLATVQ
jgi:hypothetical protein